MERATRNFQPSSSYRKQQAIFASPNRYFTEYSLWVPLFEGSTQPGVWRKKQCQRTNPEILIDRRHNNNIFGYFDCNCSPFVKFKSLVDGFDHAVVLQFNSHRFHCFHIFIFFIIFVNYLFIFLIYIINSVFLLYNWCIQRCIYVNESLHFIFKYKWDQMVASHADVLGQERVTNPLRTTAWGG